jgi:hypothetical protein
MNSVPMSRQSGLSAWRKRQLDDFSVRAKPGRNGIDQFFATNTSEATLPHRGSSPACRAKRSHVPGVTLDILRELGCPEVGPGRRRRGVGAAAVAVPEAAMNLDHCSPSRKHDVRFAGKVPCMDPETEPSCVKPASEQKLGTGVLPADAGHHPRTGFLVDDVRHFFSLARNG